MSPHRILRWASYYVGNRGVMAFTLGLIWTLIGVSTALQLSPSPPLPDSIIPLWLRSLFWIIPGAYAMGWTALTPVRRTDDHNVWAGLMLGPSARFAAFVAAGIMDMFNWGKQEYTGTWIGILAWLAVVAMVRTCAVGLDRLPPLRPGRSAV